MNARMLMALPVCVFHRIHVFICDAMHGQNLEKTRVKTAWALIRAAAGWMPVGMRFETK